jgi:hypothetical protein
MSSEEDLWAHGADIRLPVTPSKECPRGSDEKSCAKAGMHAPFDASGGDGVVAPKQACH